MEITNTYLDSFFLCEGKHLKYTSGLAKTADFHGSLLLTSSSCPLATSSELKGSTKAFNYSLKISGGKIHFLNTFISIFLTTIFASLFFFTERKKLFLLKIKYSKWSVSKSSPFPSKIFLVSFQCVTQSPGTWWRGGSTLRDTVCKTSIWGTHCLWQGVFSVTFKLGEGERER